MTNIAAWIPSKGSPLQVRPAPVPQPGPGELLIENRAVPLHPGDWKLAKGIIPIALDYPTILGNYVAGYVHKVGSAVTRFKPGDRVLSLTALAVRNDHRFGGHQRYTLATELFTVHIGDTPFDQATSAASVYAAMSALVLHLGLDRPSKHCPPKDETVLIWGGSSTIGFYAIQIASQAGYKVITTASEASKGILIDAGAAGVFDYHSPDIFNDLLPMGPFRAVFGASEAACDQLVIGKLLEAQGGGRFLTTMGVRPGVVLPPTVEGFFVQYMDDYMKPENEDYVKWMFWHYLENGLTSGSLKLGKVEVGGGLGKLQESLDRLQAGEVKGKKLVIAPHLD